MECMSAADEESVFFDESDAEIMQREEAASFELSDEPQELSNDALLEGVISAEETEAEEAFVEEALAEQEDAE